MKADVSLRIAYRLLRADHVGLLDDFRAQAGYETSLQLPLGNTSKRAPSRHRGPSRKNQSVA